MQHYRIHTWLAAIMIALLAIPVGAAELGDKAPELEIAQWVKGDPFALDGTKKAYVVEFWATWCPPCRKTVPHLTRVAKAFEDKGVVVVGISNEDAAKVSGYVEERGEEMDYHVAVDIEGKTTTAYLEPFGVRGIPHAFIVNGEGQIVWHGHPMTPDMVRVLTELAEGTFSLEAEKERAAQVQAALEAAEQARTQINAYMALAVLPSRTSEAQELGGRIIEEHSDGARILNYFAYNILANEEISDDIRDIELAHKAAARALDIDPESPEILDTYALALFKSGDTEAAITHQKKALEVAEDERLIAELQKHLDQYTEALGN